VFLLIGMAGVASAAEPTQVIKSAVDEILVILRDPKLKASDKAEEQRQRIAAVAEKFMDKKRFAQITLGRDWRRLDPKQQEEFTELYADLVEKTYIDRIREYTDEKVLITGETKASDNKAEVSTVVVSKGKEIPVVYRMYNDGGRWRTYDVLVEGVSFVMNYRSQFNDILAKGSPESLLRQLRQKVSS
jgi:phospholipid transport system substrate-binding protein